jgi:hypothetical protein
VRRLPHLRLLLCRVLRAAMPPLPHQTSSRNMPTTTRMMAHAWCAWQTPVRQVSCMVIGELFLPLHTLLYANFSGPAHMLIGPSLNCTTYEMSYRLQIGSLVSPCFLDH